MSTSLNVGFQSAADHQGSTTAGRAAFAVIPVQLWNLGVRARVWVEAESLRSRAKEGFYLESRQRAGMAFVMEIDELMDPVLVAVLGTGTVVAETADDGYQVHQAWCGVTP